MNIAEEVLVFRFKDGTEKPINTLTNEELLYAIEFTINKADGLSVRLERTDEQLEKSKGATARLTASVKKLEESALMIDTLQVNLIKIAKERNLTYKKRNHDRV